MTYAETNLFGVYVAPVSLMLLAAWIVLLPLRRLAERLGLFAYVWHPALVVFAAYVILASAIVLLSGKMRF